MSRNTSFGGFICSVLAVVVGCGAFVGLRQHFEKDDSSESETFIEGSESDSGSDIECVHADVDYNNVCDHCGVATKFEEVEIVKGEQAMGNWYRIYDHNGCVEDGAFSYDRVGSMTFFDGECYFYFGIDDYNMEPNSPLGVLSPRPADAPECLFDIFDFKQTTFSDGDYACCDCSYSDVYITPGKTFTIRVSSNAETYPEYTFTIDDSVTVYGSSPADYCKGLKVVAA